MRIGGAPDRIQRLARLGLAVALLAAAVACGGDDDDDKKQSSKTTTSRSSPTTTTQAAFDPASLTWTRRPGRLPDASNLNGVTAWNDRFIAIGVDGTRNATAIWTSDDGTGWTKLVTDPAVFPEKEYPSDIASDGTRLLIVGFLNDGARGRPRAWTSTNGTDWQRAEHSSFPGQATGLFSQVNAGGGGFVSLLSGPEGAKMVTTKDSSTWDVQDTTIAGPDPATAVSDVVAGGPGHVAVGSTGNPADAAVWTSADGNSWARSTSGDLGGARFQSASTVVVTETGLVAAGSSNTGQSEDAAVWTSPDGRAWTLVSKDAAVFGGASGEGIDKLIDTSGTLLAAGRGQSGGRPTLGIWTSGDGTSWALEKTDPGLGGGLIPRITGLAANSKAAVAVGRLMRPNQSTGRFEVADLAVWVGSPG